MTPTNHEQMRPQLVNFEDIWGVQSLKQFQGQASPFNRTGGTTIVSNFSATKADYPPGNIKKFWVCGTDEDAGGNLSVSLRWNDVGAHLDQDTGMTLKMKQ